MFIRFKCVSASPADEAELREFHSTGDITIRYVLGGITAQADAIAPAYKDMFGDNLAEYIRHAINCSFYIKDGYEDGIIL